MHRRTVRSIHMIIVETVEVHERPSRPGPSSPITVSGEELHGPSVRKTTPRNVVPLRRVAGGSR